MYPNVSDTPADTTDRQINCRGVYTNTGRLNRLPGESGDLPGSAHRQILEGDGSAVERYVGSAVFSRHGSRHCYPPYWYVVPLHVTDRCRLHFPAASSPLPQYPPSLASYRSGILVCRAHRYLHSSHAADSQPHSCLPPTILTNSRTCPLLRHSFLTFSSASLHGLPSKIPRADSVDGRGDFHARDSHHLFYHHIQGQEGIILQRHMQCRDPSQFIRQKHT